MGWVLTKIKQGSFSSQVQESVYFLPPPPLSPNDQTDNSGGFSLNNKVSPSILLVIIILAAIFFLSGLLHLLVRFILRPPNREPANLDDATALQGQLQQLFNLHDSGVDQSFIDTLPIFNYKAIIGVKTPFDCAVCLCEFEGEDKLRLLPKCSHAFHMECIDTWLLSHSTCPLCRACLLSDFSPASNFPPNVLVLDSGNESSREVANERECASSSAIDSVARENNEEFGSPHVEILPKTCEILMKEEEETQENIVGLEEKVVTVKLGKFINVDGGNRVENSGNNSHVDARRCFSMGSFEYVMDEHTSLQVPIRTPMIKKQSTKKASLPLIPGHKQAMSECDCDSRRDFNGLEVFRTIGDDVHGSNSTDRGNVDNKIVRNKKESFSVSMIWLRGKKERTNLTTGESSSRRAFSLRFPTHRNVVTADEMKAKNEGADTRTNTIENLDIVRWGNEGSELGCDEENHSCNTLDSQANTQSFTWRSLHWLMGRQNKVVHSSFSTNV